MKKLLIIGCLLIGCGRGQQSASKEDALELRALLAEDQVQQIQVQQVQTEANKVRAILLAKIDATFIKAKKDKTKWNLDLKTGTFSPIPAQPATDKKPETKK